ncbi:MAG: MerR family transcriptional regulator [Desulfovibrio sp.]|nr:MerR family transcriptional regulator [Desulfovibrio sp.]
MTVVYSPDILASMAEICKRFKVGEKQVRAWYKAGAPIAVDGEGSKTRYSAEAMRLQMWREEQSRNLVNPSPALPSPS